MSSYIGKIDNILDNNKRDNALHNKLAVLD